MKNLFYPLLFATALVSAACSNDMESDANTTDPSNKTAISFIGEDNSAAKTRYGFAGNTHIAMHIRSNKVGSTTDIRETRTVASALKDAATTPSATTYSAIEAPSGENVRYWDDAYGRSAQLSVFAVAVPVRDNTLKNNKKSLTDLLAGNSTWNTGALSEAIDWTVSVDQSGATTIADEDLTYSNNIRSTGEGGVKAYNYSSEKYEDVKNGCLQFRLKDQSENAPTDGPGKFDQGNLKFNHALSRVTITLTKGTGYGDGSFNFATGTNVTFLKAPIEGSLDIETGAWTTKTPANITKMYTTETTSSAACTLNAQMLPGYVITDGDDNNVLEFIIDDNKYFITQDMMFDALNNATLGKESMSTLKDGKVIMEQGLNYNFNITVGKSKIINVTATLEPWTEVTAADQTMDNSHITLELFTSAGDASSSFDLYRLNDPAAEISTDPSSAKNWKGNYTDKAALNQNGTTWKTEWFFENNKSFYHFRTVDAGTTIEGSDDDKVDDYFVIASGAQDDTKYHWGAPFVKKVNDEDVTSPIMYDKTNGYADILSPAIGATNSTISITELHMRSNINVVLQTTKTANAVTLETTEKKQCEVSLTYFYANGKVNMGNGLVSTTGDLTTTAAFTAPATGIDETDGTYNKTGAFTYAVVPQALVRTSGDIYVGITIKTPDNNQYYVVKSLAEIAADANGGSKNLAKNGKIDFWYPNHNYTYTFTLTKAGIKDVTCTVEKWVDVTATNQDITLED